MPGTRVRPNPEPCDGCQKAETEDLIRGLRDEEMAE